MIIQDLHYLEDASPQSGHLHGGFETRIVKVLVRQLAVASTKAFVVGGNITATATAIDTFLLNGMMF
jgi:hypothetical protein